MVCIIKMEELTRTPDCSTYLFHTYCIGFEMKSLCCHSCTEYRKHCVWIAESIFLLTIIIMYLAIIYLLYNISVNSLLIRAYPVAIIKWLRLVHSGSHFHIPRHTCDGEHCRSRSRRVKRLKVNRKLMTSSIIEISRLAGVDWRARSELTTSSPDVTRNEASFQSWSYQAVEQFWFVP